MLSIDKNKNNRIKNKRELPCKTWISTGYCSYNNKCIYLHSYSIKSNFPAKIHSNHKSKEYYINDTLFWPKMKSTNNIIDNEYSVPYPEKENMHDIALYSMWNHYVDFCKFTNMERKLQLLSKKESIFPTINTSLSLSPYDNENKHVSKKRLDIFCKLSEGKKI